MKKSTIFLTNYNCKNKSSVNMFRFFSFNYQTEGKISRRINFHYAAQGNQIIMYERDVKSTGVNYYLAERNIYGNSKFRRKADQHLRRLNRFKSRAVNTAIRTYVGTTGEAYTEGVTKRVVSETTRLIIYKIEIGELEQTK